MVRKRKQWLLLGLTMSLALAVGLPPAAASAVFTLTGENLNGSSSQGNSAATCPATYSVSGAATGPYSGTFTETGTWNPFPGTFSATFSITSDTTTISGSKSWAFGPGMDGGLGCVGTGGSANLRGVSYTATIHTPNGNFHDEGVSAVDATITNPAATLTESFTSSLAQPVVLAPTSKGQCKHGGWRAFSEFKNQGQCVSFVAHQRQT
jgi:hypothetical protein